MNAVGLVVKIEELVMKQSARKIWEKIAKIMSVQHRAQEKAIFSPKQWRTLGFSNFKIEGRGLGSALILEFLLYYMTKPEYQIHVREKIYLDNMLDLF